MQLKLIFTGKDVHLASFWKWRFFKLESSLFWVYLIKLCKGKLLFFCFRITLLWLTLCQFHNYMEIEVWFLLVISFEMRIAWLVARVLVRLKFQMMFPSSVHILSFVIDRFCQYTSLILRYITGIYFIHLDRLLSMPVSLWAKLWRGDLLLKLKNLWRKSCKYSNLFSRHFTWCYLFLRILQKEIWNFC